MILIIIHNFIMYNKSIIDNEHSDNATWVLNSAFVIITMQSGFGLLESGMVSKKNEVNIMMKNVSDIIFGGISFWILGYGLAFGNGEYSNSIIGYGDFFFDATDTIEGGWKFSKFFFQLTFVTTATTIVSGALAERCRFNAYCLFSVFNTFIYSIPAHWIFDDNGWLKQMGMIDFAGGGPVHLLGGITGLVGTILLKPRQNINPKESSQINTLFGLFMLWWGWLGFNCGSSFGITGDKWIYVSKAATNTLSASIGGGLYAFAHCYLFCNKKYLVSVISNGIISSLVSITPCCAYVYTWASILIGIIGSCISIFSNILLIKYIDDPIGCISTHASAGIWGLIATGLFVHINNEDENRLGLFYNGNFELFGIQLLGIISITFWSLITSYIFFKIVDRVVGLRMISEDEIIGGDELYHLNNESAKIYPIENMNDAGNDNDNDKNFES